MKTMYVREIQKAPPLQSVEVSFTPQEWSDLQKFAKSVQKHALGTHAFINGLTSRSGLVTMNLFGLLDRIAYTTEGGDIEGACKQAYTSSQAQFLIEHRRKQADASCAQVPVPNQYSIR